MLSFDFVERNFVGPGVGNDVVNFNRGDYCALHVAFTNKLKLRFANANGFYLVDLVTGRRIGVQTSLLCFELSHISHSLA